MGVISLRVAVALELEWGITPFQDCKARTSRIGGRGLVVVVG